MKTIRKFFRGILLSINLLLLLVFIFICYTVPYQSPSSHWIFGMLGLVFPIVFFLVLAFIVYWLLFHYKFAIFGIIAVLICWKFVSVTFAFNLSHSGLEGSPAKNITVMSYNVRQFTNYDSTEKANSRLRNKMIELIAGQHPDILCLQELHVTDKPPYSRNKYEISKRLDLPYYHYSGKHNKRNDYTDIVLFSKFPIINRGEVAIRQWREVAIYADVKIAEDTIRIFTTHLRSIRFSRSDLGDINNIKRNPFGNDVHSSKNIIWKLRKAFKLRGNQAEVLSKAIQKSPYPVIVCGDFNDPPNSYTYFTVRGDLKDTYLESGFGLGRTYSKISPTLRIDYILTSPSFQAKDFHVIHKPYSDHYPVVARIGFAPAK